MDLQRLALEQEYGGFINGKADQQCQKQQQQDMHRPHLDGADFFFACQRLVVALAKKFGFEFQ
jgi:hypothetical protein